MHEAIQQLLQWYFGLLEQVGLWGVVLLMAMESTIFPVPSELVVPPAAYLFAYKSDNTLWGAFTVVFASTVGCYLGSIITFLISRWVGRPFIVRYGKYVFIGEDKLRLAEAWVARYGAGGIFFARLLPVVRHLISIPAGVVDMNIRTFSLMTTAGSALWSVVLTVFGVVMGEDLAAVLQSGAASEGYESAFHRLTLVVVVSVAVLGALYVLVVKRQSQTA